MSNIIVSPSGGLIEFNTGVAGGDTFFPSTAPIRLDATGGNTWFTGTNVGIGTTSPDTNLQIRDYTLDSKDILHLRSSGDNVGDYVGMKFTTAAGGAGPHAAIRTYVGPYGNDSYISLLTTTDGGTLTQGLTQTHNGNVGVGVTNPAYALQVEGATYTSSTSYAITQFQLVGGKYWSFKAANSSNDLHFYAAGDGATRMALTSGGNLGIGTADPEATLQVGTHSNTMPSDTALFLGVNDLRFSTTNDNADYGSYLKPSYDAGPTPDVSILTLGTRFTTTDTDVLTLYGSDVGIGTTSPLSTLDVRGTISG